VFCWVWVSTHCEKYKDFSSVDYRTRAGRSSGSGSGQGQVELAHVLRNSRPANRLRRRGGRQWPQAGQDAVPVRGQLARPVARGIFLCRPMNEWICCALFFAPSPYACFFFSSRRRPESTGGREQCLQKPVKTGRFTETAGAWFRLATIFFFKFVPNLKNLKKFIKTENRR
jgi:hypothetical protein